MIDLERRARIFAAALAALAGYVDAVGFLTTGGYFVSFMSGNSTRLGVGIFRDGAAAAIAGGLVAAFVGGVVAGAAARRLFRRRPEAAILAGLALGLALGACLSALGHVLPAALMLAAVMGAENTVFAGAGEVRVGLTYMTGALVKIGKGLAAALFGEARWTWAPHLLLWSSLIAGAVAGAMAFDHLGGQALWPAAGAAAVLTWLSLKVFARPQSIAPM